MSLFKDKQSDNQEALDRLYAELKLWSPEDKEYAAIVQNIEVLQRIQNIKPWTRLTPDAVLSVAVTTGLTIGILLFERDGVITSKLLVPTFQRLKIK